MREFKLTVQDQLSVVAERGAGGTKTGTIQLDRLQRATIELFQQWLRDGRLMHRDEFAVLGTHLFNVLFDEEVKGSFDRALGEVAEGERLSVSLVLREQAGDLKDYPWEYLHYPETEHDRGFFFSTHTKLSLSRMMNLEQRDPSPARDVQRLRFLVVVSHPEELRIGDQLAEADSVSNRPVVRALDKIKERHAIAYDTREHPTRDWLYEIFERAEYHVLHFIGHGTLDENIPRIALTDSDGKEADWVEGDDFAELLTGHSGSIPPLVFLHLVSPPRSDAQASLRANLTALAPPLLKAGIQAVVAMRYPIPNDPAETFCRNFYEQVSQGAPIDDAVQHARRKLGLLKPGYGDRGFGVPVLYMRSRESIIPQAAAPQIQYGDETAEGGGRRLDPATPAAPATEAIQQS